MPILRGFSDVLHKLKRRRALSGQRPRYVLKQTLSQSPYAKVCRAYRYDPNSALRTEVVLKIFKPMGNLATWFSSNKSLLQNLRSLYCARVLGFECIEGRPTMVVEYIRGVTLAELLERYPNSKAAWGHEILRQVQEGLNDLRKIQLFHGDLSPRNIMLTSQGEVRLIDFGITNKSLKLATPRFAAPELLQCDSDQAFAMGHQSDLFSLGRIAEELLQPLPEIYKKNWLSSKPAKRRLVSIPASPLAQASLARAVKSCQTQTELTEPLHGDAPLSVPYWRALGFWLRQWRFIAPILCLCLVGPAASLRHQAQDFAWLNIGGRTWKQVVVNSTPVGYAPLTLPLLPYKKYSIFVQAHANKRLLNMVPLPQDRLNIVSPLGE